MIATIFRSRRPLQKSFQPATPQADKQAGITLIEVMVSLVLISTILLVSLTASANLRLNDRERQQVQDAATLAYHFLDEASALPFRDPTADSTGDGFGLENDESPADRTTFDDVDDYHQYTASPPTHRSGATIESYEDWTIRLDVYPAQPTAEGIVTSADTGSPLRLLVVRCRDSDHQVTRMGIIVSNVNSDLLPGASHQRWRRIELEFPDRTIDVSVPLRNRPLN